VRNYSLLARSYALYDQGINERLRGNYGSATDKLAESVNLLDQARSNQRDGGASTLESMVFFELAQAAEADGDFILARDSYAHCLRAKPQYVEAYLRIVSLLASQGQLPLAMNWLKEGLKECPHEPKLNDLSTVLSTFMGGYKPALERDPEPVTKPVGPETLPSEVSPESRPEAPTGSSENEPAMP
jgi:tetratricopeptide (TPR) repeat protein